MGREEEEALTAAHEGAVLDMKNAQKMLGLVEAAARELLAQRDVTSAWSIMLFDTVESLGITDNRQKSVIGMLTLAVIEKVRGERS